MIWGRVLSVVRQLRAGINNPANAGTDPTSAAYGPVFRTSRTPRNAGLDTSALIAERQALIAHRAKMVKRHKRRSTCDARLRQVTHALLGAGQ